MKITISEIGYYHPSNANWSYHIWQVDGEKSRFRIKETFGGDYRLIEKLKALGHKVEKGFIGQFEMKYRDIKDLLDIDNNMNDIIKKLN